MVVVSGYYYLLLLLLLLGPSGMKGATEDLAKRGGALVANHIFDEWELLVQPRATKESHHSQQLYCTGITSLYYTLLLFLMYSIFHSVLRVVPLFSALARIYYCIKILLFLKD